MSLSDEKLHGVLALRSTGQKLTALKKLLKPFLGGKKAPKLSACLKAIRFVVDTIGEHDTAVSRPVLEWLAAVLSEVESEHNDVLLQIVDEACDIVQAKYTYFAAPLLTLIRLKSELCSAEDHWSEAGKAMARVDTEDQYFQDTMNIVERTQWRIDTAKLFLEDDDNTNASFHIQKGRKLLRDVPISHDGRAFLALLLKTCHSRILDAERKFVAAAVNYLQLSQISVAGVTESDVVRSLENAVTCAILAPAGGNRDRVLDMLYRDERTRALSHFKMMEKMHKNMLLTEKEQAHFESSLKDHHHATLAGGLTVFQKAVYEHNMLATSKIYKNIKLGLLAELLGVSEAQAEDLARIMIEEGRMEASIDQVDGIIEFRTSKGSLLNTWDEKIQDLCLTLNDVVDAIDIAHPGIFDIP